MICSLVGLLPLPTLRLVGQHDHGQHAGEHGWQRHAKLRQIGRLCDGFWLVG